MMSLTFTFLSTKVTLDQQLPSSFIQRTNYSMSKNLKKKHQNNTKYLLWKKRNEAARNNIVLFQRMAANVFVNKNNTQ